jgi:hypothetical protein
MEFKEVINNKEHLCIKFNNQYIYKLNNNIHREDDEPAVLTAEGHKLYYKDNVICREGDKPAVIRGTLLEYYSKGNIHRIGLPARIDEKNNISEYWVKGKHITQKEEIKKFITQKIIADF